MQFGRNRRRGMNVQKLRSILTGLALSAMPLAAPACEGLVAGPMGQVVSVIDGDTVVLDTGMVVRLIGTQAPKLPLGRDGFEAWPLADEARAALESLILGERVELRYGGERIDRHGRALGQLFREDGLWVQERMLAQGLARVYSFPDNRKCLPELFAAESKARFNRLGIWTDPYYSVRSADRPEQVLARVGHYEIVEGRVLQAAEAGGRIYLNFGRRWADDVTAVIEPAGVRLFRDAGLEPLQLNEALVRVRGWVDERDGPRITVTHPEQIEVLARR
jgi:micrococcal nuclease